MSVKVKYSVSCVDHNDAVGPCCHSLRYLLKITSTFLPSYKDLKGHGGLICSQQVITTPACMNPPRQRSGLQGSSVLLPASREQQGTTDCVVRWLLVLIWKRSGERESGLERKSNPVTSEGALRCQPSLMKCVHCSVYCNQERKKKPRKTREAQKIYQISLSLSV